MLKEITLTQLICGNAATSTNNQMIGANKALRCVTLPEHISPISPVYYNIVVTARAGTGSNINRRHCVVWCMLTMNDQIIIYKASSYTSLYGMQQLLLLLLLQFVCLEWRNYLSTAHQIHQIYWNTSMTQCRPIVCIGRNVCPYYESAVSCAALWQYNHLLMFLMWVDSDCRLTIIISVILFSGPPCHLLIQHHNEIYRRVYSSALSAINYLINTEMVLITRLPVNILTV